MQPNSISSPLFLQFYNEEAPKVGGYIPQWQQYSTELRDRSGACGREEFAQYSRLIDEYIEVLRAFSKGHPIPASLGAATLKILELVLCRIFMEVSGGIQTQPAGPQARSRHGKLERPKLGKQMHELLTRGKVPPPTVTLLVSLRRQCKGAMYEPDAVIMMQQGGSAVQQAIELAGTALQSLWKHMQYTLYNQRPDELLGAHAPAPSTPSAPGYSPPAAQPYPLPSAAPYQQPPVASYPVSSQPSYSPSNSYAAPPAPISPRPADYQGPPLGVPSGGNVPQPVQPVPNPYANPPEKPTAATRKQPGRPAPSTVSGAPPPVAARPEHYQLPPAYQQPPQYYAPPPQDSYDPYAYAPPPAQQQPAAAPPVPQRPPKR